MNTPMLCTGFAKRGFDPDTAVLDLGKTVPLGRIAKPEDIADVILFLTSDAARYMVGALVEMNGGSPPFALGRARPASLSRSPEDQGMI